MVAPEFRGLDMPPRRPPSPGAETLKRTLGRNVQRRRLELGMSVDDLAARADIPSQRLVQIEAGHGNPSVDTIGRLAMSLNTPLASLFDPPAAQ